MTKKSTKIPIARRKVTQPKVQTGGSLADDLTKNAPTAREGAGNLRQRAEWFRRRRGGAASK